MERNEMPELERFSTEEKKHIIIGSDEGRYIREERNDKALAFFHRPAYMGKEKES